MGRVSRAVAEEHRKDVVIAAARLFRERGISGISVADLMSEVGMTHGGFYRQFASKEALAAESLTAAFQQLGTELNEMAESTEVRPRTALTSTYLSQESRDTPGDGCPATALGGEVSHEAPDSAVREAYLEGIHGFVEALARFDGAEASRQDNIATLCTLVGSLFLARATAGNALSDEILEAASEHVKKTEHR